VEECSSGNRRDRRDDARKRRFRVLDDNPVACCLTDAELRQREATLLAQFKSALTASEEVPDGYAFRIPGENRWLALVADLIIAERECCPFLTFELTAEPKMGALTIRITGPEGTKEFLRSILAMPQP
jgi:hypothetical protein